jgi:signal transduction histidine kinase
VRRLRALSIRFKLLAVVMITTCAALGLVAGSLALFDLYSHRRMVQVEFRTIAHILGGNSVAALAFADAAGAQQVLAPLSGQSDVLSACLFDVRGELFASYVRAGPMAACPIHPEPQQAGFVGGSFVLYHPIQMGRQAQGTLRLVGSLEPLHRRVQLFWVVLGLVMLGSALGAFALSSSLQRLVSRPIHDLATTARAISEGHDYSLRAQQRTEDEVGVAVAAFNQMLQRIQDADRDLRALNATLEQRVAERTADAEQRAAALKRSNEELERFAFVASHDLKEPLRAISSYAQLVQQKLGVNQQGEEVALYLQQVTAAAIRMQNLISDLLDYSRVGRQDLNIEAVNVTDLVQGVLSDLAASIRESGARVSHGPLPTVAADRRQMAQLLQNLIDNAIRFRAAAAPVIDIQAEPAGDLWRFAVRDNGIGIDAKYHQRVFVIFQRLHGRDRPGTGIGLAICKRIVEGHGGTIWVESQLDLGATFLFTLPRNHGGAAAARAQGAGVA